MFESRDRRWWPTEPGQPPQLGQNGAIYAFTKEFFLREGRFVTEKTAAHIMSDKRSIDIDSILDWKLAEILSNEV